MRYFYCLFLLLIASVGGIAQVINAGIGGNTTNDLLQRIDKDVLAGKPDLCIVMVGTNDMLNSKKMLSMEQYQTNLNRIVKKLKSGGSEVLLMSSPPVDSAYLFMRHDKTLYTQAPNEIMESISHIVQNVASANNVLYLNLFGKFSDLDLPRHDVDLFFRNPQNSGSKDGVHPTSLGYHFIAANVFQYLKENAILGDKKKIICFGDSITFGAGSQGGGTVAGKNYPSFLSKMINEVIK